MNTFILISLLIISFSSLLAAKPEKKGISLSDLIFSVSFWTAFDTGWWFFFNWADKDPVDLLNFCYMLSVVPALIIIYIYIQRKGIDLGNTIHPGRDISVPRFPKSKKEFIPLAVYTVIAISVVIPAAYLLDFISWAPDLRYERMPLRFIEYFLFVGLIEEMLFRGILQNQMIKLFKFNGGIILAIIISNLLFALMFTHIAVPEFPNIEYFALAFLLGLFYAGVYYHSKNIWCAAFLHGLADFLWVTFFMGSG